MNRRGFFRTVSTALAATLVPVSLIKAQTKPTPFPVIHHGVDVYDGEWHHFVVFSKAQRVQRVYADGIIEVPYEVMPRADADGQWAQLAAWDNGKRVQFWWKYTGEMT